MSAGTLADCILIFHAVFVGVVVFSVPLIIIGGLCGWRWVRSPWFRFTHLGMIGFVAFESVIGMYCPLTTWENALRTQAGQQAYAGDFIAVWLDRLLFYHFPGWIFTAAYISFAALVAALFYFVPINRHSASREAAAQNLLHGTRSCARASGAPQDDN